MNIIRVLSKSSVLSSSSLKSITPSEEVTKLQTEIDKLKQAVETLKLTVENRDAAIGTLAREKEKLYVELKTSHRTNRNLHQQLEDERNMHSKEKEYLIEEIKRVSCKNASENINNLVNNYDDAIDSILCEEIRSKDEIIYNICKKYLKMKKSKMILLQDFQELQSESQIACEHTVMLLEENKTALDDLLRKLIEYNNVPPDAKKYIKTLRHNAKLHYENTQLKVRLASVLQEKNLYQNFNAIPSDKNTRTKSNCKTKSNIFKRFTNLVQDEMVNSKISKRTVPYLINKSRSDTCLNIIYK